MADAFEAHATRRCYALFNELSPGTGALSFMSARWPDPQVDAAGAIGQPHDPRGALKIERYGYGIAECEAHYAHVATLRIAAAAVTSGNASAFRRRRRREGRRLHHYSYQIQK